MDYNKQAFEHLFKDNYPHMYRMAFSLVENADDAKDAVNQVFSLLWKNKPQIADDSIRGYLLAATRCSDAWNWRCNTGWPNVKMPNTKS